MNKKVRNIILCVVLLLVAVIYTFLVTKIDVKPIGPNGSVVGFSSINQYFINIIGSNMTIYKITEYLGYLAILVGGVYALVGLIELIKRKSLKKVDIEIYMLACFYVLVLGVYFLFEKVVINYRPILMEGILDPSFPSSHTMLALCFCGSAIIINNVLFNKSKWIKFANVCLIILMYAITIGRFISGVHWFSDIIGGIIISFALLQLFRTVLILVSKKDIKLHIIPFIISVVVFLIIASLCTFINYKLFNKVIVIDNVKYNVDGIPIPEVTGGVRGELGIDKNVNEVTIDKYLGREDSVYRDMRMLEDPAYYESIGGNRFLDGYVKGFEIVPLPYIIPVTGLPEEVGKTYVGKTLFNLNADGTYSPAYKEAISFIEKLFPKDKYIFLMCGGGGYAGMMKKFLVSMGWNENKIWVVGGYWYYNGENNIKLPKLQYGYDQSSAPYHDIVFEDLTPIREQKSGQIKLSSRYYDTTENKEYDSFVKDFYEGYSDKDLEKPEIQEEISQKYMDAYLKQGEYINSLLDKKETFILVYHDYEDSCSDELSFNELAYETMYNYDFYLYSIDPDVYKNTVFFKDYPFFPGILIIKDGQIYQQVDGNDNLTKKIYDAKTWDQKLKIFSDYIKKYVTI